MRILVYGAGAIGSLFAGKLALAGFDVSLLARGDWKTTLESQGLILEDCLSGERLLARPRVIAVLEPDDVYDFVLVTMQAGQVDAVLPILAANRSRAFVFMVNSALGSARYRQAVGADRVMLGFPAAGGERRDGVVRYYLASGPARLFQATTLGEADGSRSARLAELVKLFRRAGLAPATCRRMDDWQRCHLAVVLPIAAALRRHGCDAGRLAQDPATVRAMVRSSRQGFAALRAAGIRRTPGKLRFYNLPLFLLVPVFRAVLRTPVADYAMAKHTAAAGPELDLLEAQFRQLVAPGDAEPGTGGAWGLTPLD